YTSQNHIALDNEQPSAGAAKASPKRQAFFNPHSELQISHYGAPQQIQWDSLIQHIYLTHNRPEVSAE
ncbi:hypothetical protein ACOKXV_15830, partial [Sporosarcina psychrophila]|uniref:hypothetical protein n=1 Tax=Sporosarcina psychrophila TaxID=1476 RepID=UPI003BA1DFE2